MHSPSRIAPIAWLLVTTTLVVASFLGATLYTGRVASQIDGMAQAIAMNADPSIRFLSEVRTELHTTYNLLTLAIFQRRPVASLTPELDSHMQLLHGDVAQYTSLPFFPTELAQWQSADQDLRNTEAKISAVEAKLESGDVTGAEALHTGALASAVQTTDLRLQKLVEFDADQASRLSAKITSARRTALRASYILNSFSVVLALLMLGVGGNASGRYVRALHTAREAEGQMTQKLEAVASSALSIIQRVPHTHGLVSMLQTTVDTAKRVANADAAALGVGTDPSCPLDPFVYAGLEPALVEPLRTQPPLGVLAAVIRGERAVRIDDLSSEHRFSVDPSHLPFGPFLGAAVRHEQEATGLLFLGKRPGAAPFTEQDARAVELLATFCAVAVQNSKLYAEVRRQVATRENLLAMVSHDLRSPLSTVTLSAHSLRTSIGSDETVRQNIERIVRNAARMERMIGDLLTATRIREGRLVIEPKLQEVAPLVEDSVEPFLATAANKGVELRVELGQPLFPLFCDGGRIVQVLSNLVDNALKFTPRGGSVVVSARVQEMPESEVSFSVRDTGVGIEANAISRVFDRLWQKKEHASKGYGLGLFIAKGIVEAHRGRIWVTSRPNEGSNFQFTIPLDERQS